jgi:hypothetical protein
VELEHLPHLSPGVDHSSPVKGIARREEVVIFGAYGYSPAIVLLRSSRQIYFLTVVEEDTIHCFR